MHKPTKKTFANIGNGILAGLTAVADLPTMTRMTEIERQIDELQKEYATLNATLDSAHSRPLPYQS